MTATTSSPARDALTALDALASQIEEAVRPVPGRAALIEGLTQAMAAVQRAVAATRYVPSSIVEHLANLRKAGYVVVVNGHAVSPFTAFQAEIQPVLDGKTDTARLRITDPAENSTFFLHFDCEDDGVVRISEDGPAE